MADEIPRKIADSLIRGTVDLSRFSEGLKNKIVRVLNDVQAEIVGQIAKYDPAAPSMTKWRKDRLEKLNASVSQILDSAYADIRKLTDSELKGVASTIAKATPKMINTALGASIFGDITLTPELLRSLVTNTMIDGHIMGDWWSKASEDTKHRFAGSMNSMMQQIEMGMVEGEALNAMIGRIRGTALTPGVLSLSKREAAALVRTSTMQVAQAARMEVYRENEDVLQGFQVVATLDDRTTPLCRALDGKQYDLNLQPLNGGPPLPAGPPFHWNCRSTLIPITKSYRELARGTDLSKKQKSLLENVPRIERASVGGPVEGTMDYNQWLLTQDEAVQIDVLGAARQKLWKENKLSMTDLLHQTGRQLTLDELRAKLGDLESRARADLYEQLKSAALTMSRERDFGAYVEERGKLADTVIREAGYSVTDFHAAMRAEKEIAKEAAKVRKWEAAMKDPEATVTFTRQTVVPEAVMKSVDPDDFTYPKRAQGIGEPEGFAATKGKSRAAGVLIVEEDGRIWLVEPKGEFGGVKSTFAKGRLDPTERINPQLAAIRETFEETGLKAEVTGYLGDYERRATTTRYYIGRRVEGSPVAMGEETQRVVLIPTKAAKAVLNMDIDKTILADLEERMATARKLGEGDMHKGFGMMGNELAAKAELETLLADPTTAKIIKEMHPEGLPEKLTYAEKLNIVQSGVTQHTKSSMELWATREGTAEYEAIKEVAKARGKEFGKDWATDYKLVTTKAAELRDGATREMRGIPAEGLKRDAYRALVKEGIVAEDTDPVMIIKRLAERARAMEDDAAMTISVISKADSSSIDKYALDRLMKEHRSFPNKYELLKAVERDASALTVDATNTYRWFRELAGSEEMYVQLQTEMAKKFKSWYSLNFVEQAELLKTEGTAVLNAVKELARVLEEPTAADLFSREVVPLMGSMPAGSGVEKELELYYAALEKEKAALETYKATMAEAEVSPGEKLLLRDPDDYVDAADVIIDIEDYSVAGMHRDTVEFFKKRLLAGETIPPVYVDELKASRILDGNHRAAAFRDLGMRIPIVKANRSELLDALAGLKTDFVKFYTSKTRAESEAAMAKAVKEAPKKVTPSEMTGLRMKDLGESDMRLIYGALKKSLVTGKIPTTSSKMMRLWEGLVPDERKRVMDMWIRKGATLPDTFVSKWYTAEAGAAPVVKPVAPLSTQGPIRLDLGKYQMYAEKEGSNPGGYFHAIDNPADRWYMKFPDSADKVKNEILASKLYQLAGVEVPELVYVEGEGGKMGVASRLIDGIKKDQAVLTGGKLRAGIHENLVVDAWLGNWDVVGGAYDNLVIKDGVRGLRIDVGGSLRYRARGGLKGSAWNSEVSELESLRYGSKNPQSVSVFGKTTKEEMRTGANKVLRIKEADIKRLVDEFGPDGAAAKKDLYNTLIERQKYIQSYFSEVAVEAVPVAARLELAEFQTNCINALEKKLVRPATDTMANTKLLSVAKNKIPDFTEVDIKKVRQNIEKHLRVMTNIPLEDGPTSTIYKNLMKDGELKNQFTQGRESSSRGSLGPYKGSSRDGWEKTLTDGAITDHPVYQNAKSHEYFESLDQKTYARMRPYYGYVYDAQNPTAASQYGKLAAVLRKDLAKTATHTMGNSSGTGKISWNSHGTARANADVVYNLLSKASSSDIRALRDGTKTINQVGIQYQYHYVEAQIYSRDGLQIARDVEYFVWNRDGAVPDFIERFAERWNKKVYTKDQFSKLVSEGKLL